MMDIIMTIVMGLISGVVAKFIMPGKDPGGIIVTILIGIAGAFVGKNIAPVLGMSVEGFMGFVFSVVGALIILAIWKFLVAPMLNKGA